MNGSGQGTPRSLSHKGKCLRMDPILKGALHENSVECDPEEVHNYWFALLKSRSQNDIML